MDDILPAYEAQVRRLIRVPLNQNEFDALVSFDYSRGSGRLQKRLAPTLNAGDRTKAAYLLEHFDDAKKRDPGLRFRREAEAGLMRTSVAAPNGSSEVPSR